MGRRLYVGNLPYSATEDQLTELFGRAGKVDNVRVMRDMATGRARGFAFVEMASDEDAQKAISLRAGLVALAAAEDVVVTAVEAVAAATTMVTSQEVVARSRAGRATVQDAGTMKSGEGFCTLPPFSLA